MVRLRGALNITCSNRLASLSGPRDRPWSRRCTRLDSHDGGVPARQRQDLQLIGEGA